jgi:hypothetical protein
MPRKRTIPAPTASEIRQRREALGLTNRDLIQQIVETYKKLGLTITPFSDSVISGWQMEERRPSDTPSEINSQILVKTFERLEKEKSR